MKNFWKRLWTEINLDNLVYNFNLIKSSLDPQTLMCCVVKANAYGHHAPRVATALERAGADWFAVSNIEEAIELRHAGVELPILILGYTPPECANILCAHNISQCIYSEEYARAISEYAAKDGLSVNAHLKIDTGMGRIGFTWDEKLGSLESIESVIALDGISCEGIFTHFALSDSGVDGDSFTNSQYEKFVQIVSTLEDRGHKFKYKHCANSAATVDHANLQMNMVRVGIVLYGMMPSSDIRHKLPLKPVMSLKTVISQVKDVPCGTTVSYGCDFVSDKPMKIATIPMGYADGFWRSNVRAGTSLIVNGQKARIVGRICMDQLMLDVTHIKDVKMGDEVTVFGDDQLINTVDDIAKANGTINYEVICSVGKRVPRVFISNSRVDGVHLGLLDTTL